MRVRRQPQHHVVVLRRFEAHKWATAAAAAACSVHAAQCTTTALRHRHADCMRFLQTKKLLSNYFFRQYRNIGLRLPAKAYWEVFGLPYTLSVTSLPVTCWVTVEWATNIEERRAEYQKILSLCLMPVP